MIRKLAYRKAEPYGIHPRNAGQYFFQEALMQPAEKAPLVIVKGMAGTSKTFYSLAVGLEKVLNHPSGEYRRILICRPNAQFDDDIGFLPGDEQEKISPLMRPIMDNLEQLIDSNEEERYKDENELKGKIRRDFLSGSDPGRSFELYPWPFPDSNVSDYRRSTEYYPKSDQRNHHPCGEKYKDYSAGRSQSD